MGFFDNMGGAGQSPQMGGMGGFGGGGSPSAFTSPGMSPQALAMLLAMGRGGGAPPMGQGAAPQMGAPPGQMGAGQNATATSGLGMANQPPNNLMAILQMLGKGGLGGAGGMPGAGGGGLGGLLQMLGLGGGAAGMPTTMSPGATSNMLMNGFAGPG